MKEIVLSMILVALTSGCSMLEHRDFESEMTYDQFNSPMFMPGEDFDTIPGDNGRFYYEDPSVVKSRIPATAEQREHSKYNTSIKKELYSLENALSDQEFSDYRKLHAQFANDSERIYFLSLPAAQKRSYLESKGIVESTSSVQNRRYDSGRHYPQVTSPSRSVASVARSWGDSSEANGSSSIMLGMTKYDVSSLLGPPDRREVAGNPQYENERWTYTKNGKVQYIYFENGAVGGWSRRD